MTNQPHNKSTDLVASVKQQWLDASGIDWKVSPLNSNFHQAIVDVCSDISLCVEVGGDPRNPPLVLVMGLGSQLIFWPNEFINALINAGFFVIRFDNRDSGESTQIIIRNLERPPVFKMMGKMQVGLSNKNERVAYDLNDMAEDVRGLIHRLGFAKVSLMGASMGGIIAQLVAGKHRELVDNLILLFTTTNKPMATPPRPKQFQALFKTPKSMRLEDMVDHSVWFMNVVGTPGHINEEQVRAIATLRHQRCANQRGTNQQFHAILATGSIVNTTKKIIAPTLVLHGDKDGLLPWKNGHDVAKLIKGAEFKLIEGMGHDIPDYYQDYIVQSIVEHCL